MISSGESAYFPANLGFFGYYHSTMPMYRLLQNIIIINDSNNDSRSQKTTEYLNIHSIPQLVHYQIRHSMHHPLQSTNTLVSISIALAYDVDCDKSMGNRLLYICPYNNLSTIRSQIGWVTMVQTSLRKFDDKF